MSINDCLIYGDHYNAVEFRFDGHCEILIRAYVEYPEQTTQNLHE